MKRVAISTICSYYLLANYGSFLQHYSLRKVLTRMGYTPFRVRGDDEFRPVLEHVIEFIKDLVRPFYWMIFPIPNHWAISRTLFASRLNRILFRWDYRRLIGCFSEPQKFDGCAVGVLGSDQVLCGDSDRQWLDVLPVQTPLVAYAASTDWTRNSLGNSQWTTVISNKLNRFSAIGIRERHGVDIIKTLLPDHKNIRHVADPVQLLTVADFRAIQSPQRVFKRPTLFCYLVNINSIEDLHLDLYRQLAKQLCCKLRILGIQGAERFIPRVYRVFYSPMKFLRAIDDSAAFITNSYHGSVLGLHYHKAFLSVWQKDELGSNQNERQKELMCKFGLSDRWVSPNRPLDELKCALLREMDWGSLDERVEDWRAQSLTWLTQALGSRGDI